MPVFILYPTELENGAIPVSNESDTWSYLLKLGSRIYITVGFPKCEQAVNLGHRHPQFITFKISNKIGIERVNFGLCMALRGCRGIHTGL